MKITIFGGASPKKESSAYKQAYNLGKNLALAGHTVITGGYHGTMEAISHGAFDANGHVIGITCVQIENWRSGKANPWVVEEHKTPTLYERLRELIELCDAAIALPGGAGTLAEIALTWNLMIIEAIPSKPLVLVGDNWNKLIPEFFRSFDEYIQPFQQEYIQFARDTNEADLIIQKIDNRNTDNKSAR